MSSDKSSLSITRRLQRGVAAIEFALVLIPFLLLLLGAIEFGRLLYVWNTVQEVTRNAARQAVVRDFKTSEREKIQNLAVFRGTPGSLPAAPEITNTHIVIRYLNAAEEPASPMPSTPGDNISACQDLERVNECIRYVEVCVSTGTTCAPGDVAQMVPFSPLIGLFSQDGPYSTDLTGLRIPLSTVRMPAESLGFRPDA